MLRLPLTSAACGLSTALLSLSLSLSLTLVLPRTSDAQRPAGAASERVFTYGASARAPARWQVDPRPLTRIGGSAAQGPAELAQVLGVARLADGRVVIADGGSTELRVFSADGRFIRAIGRKGQGPGEFDGIQIMHRSADTLVVHDRTSRLQIYDAEGTLLRSYARPVFPGRGTLSWPGMLSDGSGVVQGVDPVTDSTSARVTATASLAIRPPDSTDVRAFTSIPVFERVRRGGAQVAVFLGAVSRVAVMGERVCAGYSLTWQVRCFDRRGTPVSRTVRSVSPGAVTGADKESFRAGYLAANKGQPPERVRAALDRIEYAQQRSAFGRFVPSPTGELWVGAFVALESFIPGRRGPAMSPTATTWSVIGTDGAWIAEVILPAQFSLLDAGRDYVAGVELDSDDVETVVVYRLRR